MALELRDDIAVLAGVVTVEEAEPLAAWLRGRTAPRVDLTACTHLHTAAVQALLYFTPALGGVPTDAFLAGHVWPNLQHPDGPAPDGPDPDGPDPDGHDPHADQRPSVPE